jgi:hypothetical protein
MKLLISNPSDLFQIEVSYYIKPKNVKLFIHVTMAPIHSLLHILKFHPFLLLFTETHLLLPMLHNSLSNELHNHLHAEMHPYTLVGCQWF